eukprot:1161033-Pelagomonas_calceolata.AAC.2
MLARSVASVSSLVKALTLHPQHGACGMVDFMASLFTSFVSWHGLLHGFMACCKFSRGVPSWCIMEHIDTVVLPLEELACEAL